MRPKRCGIAYGIGGEGGHVAGRIDPHLRKPIVVVRAVVAVLERTVGIIVRPYDRILDAVAHSRFVERPAVDVFFAEERAYGCFVGARPIDARVDVVAISATRVQVHDQKAHVFVVGLEP